MTPVCALDGERTVEAERNVGGGVDLEPFDLGGGGGAQPRAWSAETPADEGLASAPRKRRNREVPDVTASWTPPPREDLGHPRPAPVDEEVRERPAGQQPATSCEVEQRKHGVCRCRKQQPDGEERTLGIGTEELELVADLQPLPVAETEVRDDALLMSSVAGRRRSRVAQCHRNGVRVASAPGSSRGRRQQPGGLPAPRERDETVAARERRLENVVDGVVQGGSPAHDGESLAIVGAQHRRARDLERRQPGWIA